MSRRRTASRGFTLIELMVAVTVVAILMAVAVPTYDEQVRKARRTTAKGDLQGLVQSLERQYTLNTTYVGADCAALAATSDYYTYSCTEQTKTRFTAQGVPSGAQAVDRCGTLIINSTGARTVSGATLTAEECW